MITKLPQSSPSEPPLGVVTLMFTDIEGSSRLWAKLGDAFIPVWQAHDALIRDAITRYGGYEVKSEGDSFMIAFADAADAVNCALYAQIALTNYPWPPDVGMLRVRMGLHTGEPFVHRNDYFGPVVNRAAEISAAAHGGQILLSDTTQEMAGDTLDPDIDFLDFGDQRMKDLGAPQHLYQVSHPALEAHPFPPPRTLEGQPNNLPLQRTSFVGRAKEIQQIAGYLARGSKPLLTLTGPGGIGKTRLSLQVAAATAEWFPDGVWYVRLVTAKDVIGAALEIAAAMEMPLKPDQSVLPQVREWLADRRCLLILDDANTLPQADRLIRELLSNSTHLRCLATSRESLQIEESDDLALQGLQTVTDQPLLPMVTIAKQAAEGEVTENEAQQLFQQLIQTDAGRLFIERALAANPQLNLSLQELKAIEGLLQELDGAPVSIERAAQMMDRVSPTVVLDWLSQRLAPERVPAKNPGVEKFRRILRQSAQKVQNTMGDMPKTMEARFGQFLQSVLDTTNERRDPQQAKELRQDALRIAHASQDIPGMAHAMRHLARVKWEQGDRQSAVALLSSAAQLYREQHSEVTAEVQRELDEAREQLGHAEDKMPIAPSVEGAIALALENH